MLKVLHCTSMQYPIPGIIKQMEDEQKSAAELGINWSVKIFLGKKIESPITIHLDSDVSKFNFKIQYYNWLINQSKQFDIILMRHSVCDPFEYIFVKYCKIPVLTVHHTLEVPEILSQGGLKNFIKGYGEHYITKLTLANLVGIVGVTDEIIDYERSKNKKIKPQSFLYPNGIDFKSIDLTDERGNVPEILFIASEFADWHGLDLLLEELPNNGEDFILHLVGNMNEKLQAIASSDKRCIIYGTLGTNEIRQLERKAWIGLSSFALYRKNMKVACTLKVREYLKFGIPVYSGHKDVIDNEMKFYLNGDCNLASILNFAREMRKYSKDIVSGTSRDFIDKSIILRRLYDSLTRFFSR